MSAIAVNNNNDKNEVENIIIYFETLPPVMINLIIQFLKLKGEVEYGLTLGGNPSSEVYRLQVGEALQFSLTCKLHHQIFDDSFQYFCFRDFGANINAANVFYPTLIEGDGINERIKFNDGVVTGLPIQLYTDTSDSKMIWKNYYHVAFKMGKMFSDCVGKEKEKDEKYETKKKQKMEQFFSQTFFKNFISIYNRFANVFQKFYNFNRENCPEMFQELQYSAIPKNKYNPIGNYLMYLRDLKAGQSRNEARSNLIILDPTLRQHFDALNKRDVPSELQMALGAYFSIHNGQVNPYIGTYENGKYVKINEQVQYDSGKLNYGQLGGYDCYNLKSRMRLEGIEALIPPRHPGFDDIRNYLVFARDNYSLQRTRSRNIYKCYYIDLADSCAIKVGLLVEDLDEPSAGMYTNLTIIPGNSENPGEPFITFFETFANKLENGGYKFNNSPDIDLRCLSVFPTSGKYFKSCITRNEYFPEGILVTSSAIPLLGTNMGWTYSIRIKVLPDATNNKRCQLVSRHWRIGKSSGETERVDGPGVVGKFPVFSTTNFVHVEPDGHRNPLHLTVSKPGEEFIYQSCTGNRGTTSFGGEIKFRLVPENEKREDHVAYNNRPLDKGLGFFNVKLETFPIDPMDELDWVL